jgi:heme oxygenase (mycobilin-producing)
MFIAINYIQCREEYQERFEMLLKTRAMAIDTMPGFLSVEMLRPCNINDEYLIISRWESEEFFRKWTTSPQFLEGHRRGFEDLTKAKIEGRESPIKSTFTTYTLLAE